MKSMKYIFSVSFLCAITFALAEADNDKPFINQAKEKIKETAKAASESIENIIEKGTVILKNQKEEVEDPCPFSFLHGPVKRFRAKVREVVSCYQTKKHNFLEKVGKIVVCTQEYGQNLSEVIWQSKKNDPEENIENISSESADSSSEKEPSQVTIVDDTLTTIRRKTSKPSAE